MQLFHRLNGDLSSVKAHTVGQLRQELGQGVSGNLVIAHNGRLLAYEDAELSLFGLSDGDFITATFALEGGAKGKKKKKQYTTPKHVAHKKKKVKLAVLKYYRIDGDEFARNRMTCVNKTCGKGVFMAAHHDRAHCGRCGVTLFKKDNN